LARPGLSRGITGSTSPCGQVAYAQLTQAISGARRTFGSLIPRAGYAVPRLAAADRLLRGRLTDDRVWGFVRSRYRSGDHRSGFGGRSGHPGSWNEAAIAAHDQGCRRPRKGLVGSNGYLVDCFRNTERIVI